MFCHNCGLDLKGVDGRKRYCNDTCRRGKTISNFWSKVDKGGECWIWTGAVGKNGYGCAMIFDKHTAVHKFSYVLHNGKIINNLDVCHTCDNTLCVNPDHLFLGTPVVNMVDCISKGRLNPKRDMKRDRLSEDEVFEIRNDYKLKKLNGTQLAHKFNVSDTTIYAILGNKTHLV